MIGTKIRGAKHLFRLLDEHGTYILFKPHASRVVYGEAFAYPNTKYSSKYCGSSDCVLVFNNSVGSGSSAYNHTEHDNDDIRNASMKYGGICIINVSNTNDGSFAYFGETIVLPKTFEKDYADFIEANKKAISGLCRITDVFAEIPKYLYVISSGSKNYFLWLMSLYFKQGVHLSILEHIMTWCDTYGYMSGDLKKGTPTAYTKGGEIGGLLKEMYTLRRGKRASNTINTFNTTQKKALKSTALTDDDYDVLSKFGKLSFQKRSNFIKKVSSIEDPREILRLMSFLTDRHFSWNKQSLMEFIHNSESMNCEVVYDKDNIVLLKVLDFDTVKRLAKTTNWCISKNKSYWNEYVVRKGRSTQYVLFDFSRKEDDRYSIVGFTSLHNKGIILAHDFNNNNIMGHNDNSMPGDLIPFISPYLDNGDIESILKMDGIGLSLVTTYDVSDKKWDKESVLRDINKFVYRSNYYVLSDDGDKMSIVTSDSNILKFIGGDAQRFLGMKDAIKYILFFDFGLNANNANRLRFGIIGYKADTMEEFCMSMRDARSREIRRCSFNALLDEYGLPYDVISRSSEPIDMFYDCLEHFESKKCGALMKDASVLKNIAEHDGSNSLISFITASLLSYHSLDYINLFYDNNVRLKDITNLERVMALINDIIVSIAEASSDVRRSNLLGEKYIKMFDEGTLNNHSHACVIGYYKAYKMIIDNEIKTANEFKAVYKMFKKSLPIFDDLMMYLIGAVKRTLPNESKLIADMAAFCTSKRLLKSVKLINPSYAEKENSAIDSWFSVPFTTYSISSDLSDSVSVTNTTANIIGTAANTAVVDTEIDPF